MRYVIAMLFAIIGAALMMAFLSSNLASAIVATQRFTSPDDVADMHTALFMAFNLAGLIAGWTIGWLIGAAVVPSETAPE
jgi:F0F1-type ATP synthase membrane subunit c/vacuolar-type H+-ATPase subunit K